MIGKKERANAERRIEGLDRLRLAAGRGERGGIAGAALGDRLPRLVQRRQDLRAGEGHRPRGLKRRGARRVVPRAGLQTGGGADPPRHLDRAIERRLQTRGRLEVRQRDGVVDAVLDQQKTGRHPDAGESGCESQRLAMQREGLPASPRASQQIRLVGQCREARLHLGPGRARIACRQRGRVERGNSREIAGGVELCAERRFDIGRAAEFQCTTPAGDRRAAIAERAIRLGCAAPGGGVRRREVQAPCRQAQTPGGVSNVRRRTHHGSRGCAGRGARHHGRLASC